MLWPLARVAELDCHTQAVWFVARPGGEAPLAAIPGLAKQHADRDVLLFRSPGRRC